MRADQISAIPDEADSKEDIILTLDEWRLSQELDREAALAAMPPEKRARAAYMRTYNAAHREERAAYKRAYDAAHREEIAAYQRAYYAAHREERAAYRRAYYAAHREERAAYWRAYRAAHKKNAGPAE